MRTFVQWLRLMRFPLVFTAIGDAWAVRFMAPPDPGVRIHCIFFWGSFDFVCGSPTIAELAILAGVSFCLYAFGMILNDVMDAARDPLSKPIPSGAISRSTAAAVATGAGVGAIALAWDFTVLWRTPGSPVNPLFVQIATFAAILIFLYNVGLKRIPFLGLLLLGLIRAVQCQISVVTDNHWNGPAWNSLFLFAHVTVVSWIAYNWEGKKPRVGRVTRWGLAFTIVLIGFAMFDLFDLAAVKVRLSGSLATISALRFLVLPLIAAGLYLVILSWILASRRFPAGPDKGRAAMRIGLLWLLVYDAAFCAAAGRWTGVIAEAALLACALLSSRGMIVLSRRAGLITASTIDDSSKSG